MQAATDASQDARAFVSDHCRASQRVAPPALQNQDQSGAGDERLIRGQSLSRSDLGRSFRKISSQRNAAGLFIPITAMCTRGKLVVSRIFLRFPG